MASNVKYLWARTDLFHRKFSQQAWCDPKDDQLWHQGLKTYLQEAAEFTLEANGYHFRKLIEYLSQKGACCRRRHVSNRGSHFPRGILFGWRVGAAHVSESTMRRYLNTASATLRKYHLEWILQPVNLSGSEANIRKFLKIFITNQMSRRIRSCPQRTDCVSQWCLLKIPTALGEYRRFSEWFLL